MPHFPFPTTTHPLTFPEELDFYASAFIDGKHVSECSSEYYKKNDDGIVQL